MTSPNPPGSSPCPSLVDRLRESADPRAHVAAERIEELERLLDWCEPRLRADAYRQRLLEYRAHPSAPDHTPIVQSSAGKSAAGRIAELETALDPFALAVSQWQGEPDSLPVEFCAFDHRESASAVVGDFRRAYAARHGRAPTDFEPIPTTGSAPPILASVGRGTEGEGR